MKVRVDARIFDKRMKELSELPEHLVDEALELTKQNTPAQSGHARDNTVKRGNSIVSNYAYAGRLDQGYSKQAPRGFTKPTIEQLRKETDNFVRKI